MKPAVLLIDLQADFLGSPALEPAAGQVVAKAARLLEGARAAAVPVIHVWTTVDPADDRRMPHWKQAGRWDCVAGSAGHAPPPSLRPAAAEPVVHKVFFSAFSTGELEGVLSSLEVDTLVVAGVHLHACIRATVLDAYQRGFVVWVAEDAVASDDPLHAAVTQRYLASRAARFVSVESCLAAMVAKRHVFRRGEDSAVLLPAAIIGGATVRDDGPERLVHSSPRHSGPGLWCVPIGGQELVSLATAAARRAWLDWRRTPSSARAAALRRLAGVLDAHRDELAGVMAEEIGKPVALAQAEVSRSVALLQAAALRALEPLTARCSADSTKRYTPLGVIAVVTPWNNPVAIPLGKIAPALAYGNAVVWKPSPAGSGLAVKLMAYLHEAGFPPGLVNLVCGDRATALTLIADAGVDGVTITGSPAAGHSAHDVCARRHLPLQAELGGNNAAIIWSDGDLQQAAFQVAEAAFAFAGQRCTANRRAIVEAGIYDAFLERLRAAVAALVWGDPIHAATCVGPLISMAKRREVAALVDRAKRAATAVFTPHATDLGGAYFPPTIVCSDAPTEEIVQEETFGPVLVVQRAEDWADALRLCNGVRQGLVAALFSRSRELQERFLEDAQAGILKINMATADANVEAPFGGWKASGSGPPEHGASNREFYTRTQALYQREG